MNKYITHTSRLKDTHIRIREFQSLIKESLRDKLHKFIQMPPSFKFTNGNLELVIENTPAGEQNVIEFRHLSWWNEKVEIAFRKANYIFCNVDYPGLKTHIAHTPPDFYFRFHGPPDLFKSKYTDESLENFYRDFPKASSFTIHFNNTFYDTAYQNAILLRRKFETTLEKIILHDPGIENK